ncbi:hypothetical protein FRC07_011704 [Ceratobasidium sp. 392]|nr:hypothetical protein FRC07_011704 [Ceratobasidium sp. 392]
MSYSPEHANLSPAAFDRDGFRLSVEPEVRSTSHSPIPPPKTPTPPHSQIDINVSEAPRSSLAVLIIKPHAVKQRLKIEKRVVETGFEIVKASGRSFERKMGFHIESPGVVEMFASDAPSLCGEPVWVYVLSRAKASSVLVALAGPVDPLAARKSDPDSLRALYGSNRWENGVWVTRDESTAERVVGELFAGSPIMDFSDLPSVNGSPDRRRVRKAASHTSSIRSDFTESTGARRLANSTSTEGADLKAARRQSMIDFPAARRELSPEELEEKNRATFEGVPGHKRRESISVASTAPPVVAPRVNRSSMLRAQKMAAAATGGSGGPPSAFKGALEVSPAPARSLSSRSSRASISGPPTATTVRSSASTARPTITKTASKTNVAIPATPDKGGALTPISNGAMTPRTAATPTVPAKPAPGSPKKPDIVPRTNKSALLRAAAKLKAVGGSVGKGSAGRKSLAI